MDGLGTTIHHLSRKINRIRKVDSQTGPREETTLQGIESRPLVPPRRDCPGRIRGHRRVSHDQRLLHLRETSHRRQTRRIPTDLDDYSMDLTSERGSYGSS